MSQSKAGGADAADDELQAIFARAAKIAESVPEALKEAAFQRALDALLPGPPAGGVSPPLGAAGPRRAGRPGASSANGAAKRGAKEGLNGGGPAPGEADVVERLSVSLNRTELAELMAGRKVLDRSLLVLRAAQHHGIEAMAPREIAEVLTRKFRERTKTEAVRVALERAPSYTDRQSRGGATVYVLMAPGERYLDAPADGAAGAGASRPRARPRRRGGDSGEVAEKPTGKRATKRDGAGAEAPRIRARARAERGGTGKGGKAPGEPAKTSGKPGPKAMLEALIGEGLFDSAQTMGSLIAFLKEKRGRTYGAGDFGPTLTRLIREQKLDRDRNAEGQFQYRRHRSA